jgi:hypothetical protein
MEADAPQKKPCRSCRFARLYELPRVDPETEPNWICGFSGRNIVYLQACAKYEREPGSDDDL